MHGCYLQCIQFNIRTINRLLYCVNTVCLTPEYLFPLFDSIITKTPSSNYEIHTVFCYSINKPELQKLQVSILKFQNRKCRKQIDSRGINKMLTYVKPGFIRGWYFFYRNTMTFDFTPHAQNNRQQIGHCTPCTLLIAFDLRPPSSRVYWTQDYKRCDHGCPHCNSYAWLFGYK